jgi:hypothetical protein
MSVFSVFMLTYVSIGLATDLSSVQESYQLSINNFQNSEWEQAREATPARKKKNNVMTTYHLKTRVFPTRIVVYVK